MILKLCAQLKYNLNTTEIKQFSNCFISAKTKRPSRETFSPVLASYCPYPLFARQARGEGGAMTYA